MNKIIIFFSFIFAHLSCTQGGNNNNDDIDSSRERTSRSVCRNSGNRVTINNLDDISRNNAGEYTMSGRCDSRNVEISIEDQDTEIFCQSGRWRVDLDVTSVVQGRDRVDISIRSGSNSACETVKNDFHCPDEYIPVPRLDKYTSNDFCVMKYEAKREREDNRNYYERDSNRRDYGSGDYYRNQRDDTAYYEKALSQSRGDPWTQITQKQAVQKCRNNGAGYQLISNKEWQTIARHIESVDENWAIGKAVVQESNALNRGLLGGYGSSSNTRVSSRSSWSDDKRNHLLPNGVEIFDFSGSVWEMVYDSAENLGIQEDKDEYILNLQGQNKELFGPKYNYSSIDSRDRIRSYGGLGYAYLSDVEDVVIRGGATERDAGVFAVNSRIQDDRALDRRIGFRCVYYP